MLVLSLLISFLGFVIIAPGAVFILGRVTTRQNGIISVVGPIVNLVLALAFLPLLLLFPQGLLHDVGLFGFVINSWLALFNMIPVSVLDGRKVWLWNKAVFFVVIGLSVVFVFFSMGLFVA